MMNFLGKFFLAVWLAVVIISPPPALAQGFGNLIGGKIIETTVCCNGWKITVGPPNPGSFLFVWGVSTLYPYYNIWTPGVYVLGTAFGAGTCQRLTGFIPCTVPEPVTGIIRMIGTSGLL